MSNTATSIPYGITAVKGVNKNQILPVLIDNCENNKNYQFKKHKCPVCSFRSLRKGDIKKHLQAKHKNFTQQTSNIMLPSSKAHQAKIITSGSGGVNAVAQANNKIYLTEESLTKSHKIQSYDLRLIENFKIYLTGSSRSGKTDLVGKMLENILNLCKERFDTIIWVYASWQAKYEKLRQIVSHFIEDDKHLQSYIESLTQDNAPALIIFDDCMNSEHLKYIMHLFTVSGRHKGMSLVFVTQKMFTGDNYVSKISQNSDYLIVMKNKRNLKQFQILAAQIDPSPGSANRLLEIYKAATKKEEPYTYLLMDLTPECPPYLQYRSHLFSQPGVVRVYALTEDLESLL